jgi:enoyl-CoA hydratase/carnithine racemase
LSRAWLRFRDDDALVAIVTGAGERAFSVGADLTEMRREQESQSATVDEPFRHELPSLQRGLSIAKPIIAAINGYCLGGGLELALACDLRVAAEHARFGLTEVQHGLFPGGGGIQRLCRLVPFGVALRLVLTGEQIDAGEAHRIGLVNVIVPAARLLDQATSLGERIAANAPLAVRAAKESAYRAVDSSLDSRIRADSVIASLMRQTADAREGARAFAEKRRARFSGR